jgi:predicted RNA methylase
MFDTEFYPTPAKVIALLMNASIFKSYLRTPILDPSAGNGAILEYLEKNGGVYNTRLFAIEKNLESRYILQGKGFKVIATDFLEFNEPMTFPTIIMNPPFSNATKHILKAWTFLEDNGRLVSLINTENIKNPYSKNRQNLLELIELYGKVEHLGSVFKDSDNPTNVEVSMIVLTKPPSDSTNWFKDVKFEKDYLEEGHYQSAEISLNDPIAALVSRYNGAIAILKERHQSQQKLHAYLSDICTYSSNNTETKALEQPVSLTEQVRALKSRFWQTLFLKTEISKRTTSSFHTKFDSFCKSQSELAFTEENIKEMLSLFFCNQKEIMRECVIDVFDRATRYHKKNYFHNEGWKTNKSYKLGKKIIVPYGFSYEYGWRLAYGSQSLEFYNDLDKALCYLSGQKIENILTIEKTMKHFIDNVNSGITPYDSKFTSTFFTLRMFKKGTVHLVFNDLKILEDFNKFVGENKKWIGADY